MDSLQLMTDEHKYIKELLKKIRSACLEVMNQPERVINTHLFSKAIEFIREYADKHHHGKEEDMLFAIMRETGGNLEQNLVSGMETEHNLGRLYVSQLEQAIKDYQQGTNEAKLDIVANAMAYVYLLNRHIDKEDETLYQYAKRSLSEESLTRLNQLVAEYENDPKNKKVREKMLANLETIKEESALNYQ